VVANAVLNAAARGSAGTRQLSAGENPLGSAPASLSEAVKEHARVHAPGQQEVRDKKNKRSSL